MATTPAVPRLRPLIALLALAALVVTSVAPAAASASADRAEREVADAARSLGPVLDPTQPLGPFVPQLLDLGALFEAAAEPETREARERTRSRPFSMNLFSKGDFVNQKTTYWCIPASTQTMMNIMDDGRPNRSRKRQARLYRIGDRLEEDGTFSDEREPDRWRGMGISEWAGLLNRFGYGPYELAGAKSRQNALRKAARMMRKTGKPVGLVVWRGAHAWVMSGFKATADPAETSDFKVTAVWVHDPWYPRVSSFWGRSRPPNQRVSPKVLGQDFKRYGRPGRRNPERDGRFMLVLPRPGPGAQAG